MIRSTPADLARRMARKLAERPPGNVDAAALALLAAGFRPAEIAARLDEALDLTRGPELPELCVPERDALQVAA